MMKLPLNYAILLYFVDHPAGDADSVIEALTPEYADYRAFKRPAVIEAIMTAKENGILEEDRTELGEGDKLRLWYRLTPYGKELIERFL